MSISVWEFWHGKSASLETKENVRVSCSQDWKQDLVATGFKKEGGDLVHKKDCFEIRVGTHLEDFFIILQCSLKASGKEKPPLTMEDRVTRAFALSEKNMNYIYKGNEKCLVVYCPIRETLITGLKRRINKAVADFLFDIAMNNEQPDTDNGFQDLHF